MIFIHRYLVNRNLYWRVFLWLMSQAKVRSLWILHLESLPIPFQFTEWKHWLLSQQRSSLLFCPNRPPILLRCPPSSRDQGLERVLTDSTNLAPGAKFPVLWTILTPSFLRSEIGLGAYWWPNSLKVEVCLGTLGKVTLGEIEKETVMSSSVYCCVVSEVGTWNC
jgi:hypothetical protein